MIRTVSELRIKNENIHKNIIIIIINEIKIKKKIKKKKRRKKIISMPLIPICLIHIFKYIRQYRFNKREICLSMYVFVSEDHMLDWHLCQIYYPLEMKLS